MTPHKTHPLTLVHNHTNRPSHAHPPLFPDTYPHHTKSLLSSRDPRTWDGPFVGSQSLSPHPSPPFPGGTQNQGVSATKGAGKHPPPFLNTWTSPQQSRVPEYLRLSSSIPSTCDERKENTVSVTASSALGHRSSCGWGLQAHRQKAELSPFPQKKTAKTPVEKAPAFHGRPPKSTFI